MSIKTIQKILFLSLVLLAFSCKKEGSSGEESGDSYVKVKIDGKWVTFKGLGEVGPDLMDDTKTNLGINGYSYDNKELFDIGIQLDGQSFPEGIYKSDVYSPYHIFIDYTITTGTNIKSYSNDHADSRPPSKYIINVTSISPKEIKGSFTGNYLYDHFSRDEPNRGIIEITEGEFKVKRVR